MKTGLVQLRLHQNTANFSTRRRQRQRHCEFENKLVVRVTSSRIGDEAVSFGPVLAKPSNIKASLKTSTSLVLLSHTDLVLS